VSFAVKNLLDERFDFQQEPTRRPIASPVAIDRWFIDTIPVSF
jgi:hypothetical protein